MLSPASPALDENHIPGTQTVVHRKSIGRTSAKVLGVLDPNSLNQRLSLAKPSSSTILPDKETSLVSTSIPVWVDSCPDDDLLKSSAKHSSFSLETKESCNIKADDQCSQPHTTVLVSNIVCSNQAHKAVLENSDNKCLEECNTITILPLDASVNETSPTDGQQTASSDVSVQTVSEVCTNTVTATHLEASADLCSKSPLNKVSLSYYTHCAKLATEVEEPSQVADDIGFISESNNLLAADINFEIISNLSSDSEVCPLPMLSGEISDLTEKIETWGIFRKEDDQAFLGNAVNEDKTEHIVDVSSAIWDSAVVLDKLDSIASHVILDDDCSLPAKTLTLTIDEFLSSSIVNSTENGLDMRESEDKRFFPIGGSTPHCKQKKRNSTKVTSTECMTSNSGLASDPQKYNEVAASVNCNCPTPVIPPPSRFHDVLSLSRRVCKDYFPETLASVQEVGTSMTPVSTCEEITWTTPIMLLNKSMNTSWNLKGKGVKSAKDNASETDSLLWNFSKEAFCNASREELVHRLEGTLIIVEALSRQLQEWQEQKVPSRPSEQREVSTQTCVTYDNEEERYYRTLYFKTLSRHQAFQRCCEEEKQLNHALHEAMESYESYMSEAASMAKFAVNLYETVQKDRADLNQKAGCMQSLFAEYMTFLSKMNKKMENLLHEKEEMKTRMEEALLEKTAADQCLEDLEIHSSAVISQLRRDLETERTVCKTVRDAYEQQFSYNEELDQFILRARSICSEVEDDRSQLLMQCSQARELISRYWRLFTVMKEKTQDALEDYDRIKNERDDAIYQNTEMSSKVENLKAMNEQMKLENSRLGLELKSLMERFCNLQAEIVQWKEENSELGEKLSARDSSMKLLEKELNEATARGQAYQDRIKHLSAEVVPSLELKLSEVSSQKESFWAQLQALENEHALQATRYTEILEYLEQENRAIREQMAENESLIQTNHVNLLERNDQIGNLKDTIKALEKEASELKQRLADAEEEARYMKAKTAEEVSTTTSEASKIKAHLLDVIRNLKESSQREVNDNVSGLHTPGGSLTLSNTFCIEDLFQTALNTTGSEDPKADRIWSETSAFTVVKSVVSPAADTQGAKLADTMHELSSVVLDVVTAASRAMDIKQDCISNLKMDICALKRELQNQRLQHESDLGDLQEELKKLRKRNVVLEEKLTSKEKYIGELEKLVHQRERKILQQQAKMNESEDFAEENSKLKLSLKQYESEVEVLRRMLAQNPSNTEINWIEEKVMMEKELTALRLKLSTAEYSNSDTVQKLMKHRDILTANLAHSEAEVQKLDDIIEKIRMALQSVPDVVKQSETLRQLREFLD